MSEYTQINYSPKTVKSTPGTVERDESRELALTIARAAEDRKGGNIVLLKVGDVSVLSDYFIIVTGFSKVQVRAISQSIQDNVEQEWQRRPLRVEGQAQGTWVLLDYGEAIVHILLPHEREFYNLEAFWGHAERIDYTAPTQVGD